MITVLAIIIILIITFHLLSKRVHKKAPKSNNKYKIQLKKNVGNYWYWRITHINGNILAISESYSSKQAARDTAQNLKDSLFNSTIEEIHTEEED